MTEVAIWSVGSGAYIVFFFSSRRRHTIFDCDWSSDVCSSDLTEDELRAAGTGYPGWLAPYLTYPGLTSTPAFVSGSTGQAGVAPSTSLTIVPADRKSVV